MKIKAMIFDLDGTLLDTLQDIADSLNPALVAMGLKPHHVNEFLNFVGDGVFELVKRAVPKDYRDDWTVGKLVEGFRDNYKTFWSNRTVIYPGVSELLKELHARGIRTCVLSNKPDDFTCEMVDHYFHDHPFDFVMGHKKDFPAKPDPDSTLHILETLGVTKDQAAYIGDMHVDIETGINAGILPVGVSWGFQSAEKLREMGAKVIVDHPQELLELV